VSLPKYQQAAGFIRDQIKNGTLAPGAPAPSGAALSRTTGYSVLTCRRALRTLVTAGVLTPGASQNARPRVPGPGDQALADAKRALSAALAKHRHRAGLTQPGLARLIGLSVTSIGHAETGRTWQSRPFWELADKALNAGGDLLRLHDAYRTAEVREPISDTQELSSDVREDTLPEVDSSQSTAAIRVDVPGPVNSITITWVGGAVTTVYSPTPTDADDGG
jgi:DNA-binding transcriptional MocR family regulator